MIDLWVWMLVPAALGVGLLIGLQASDNAPTKEPEIDEDERRRLFEAAVGSEIPKPIDTEAVTKAVASQIDECETALRCPICGGDKWLPCGVQMANPYNEPNPAMGQAGTVTPLAMMNCRSCKFIACFAWRALKANAGRYQ